MSATRRPRIALLACVIAGSAVSSAGELRVAPGGSPLTRASERARPGDVIVLAGGVYETPIRPERSGAPGRPIVYRAAPGEKPVLTGMVVAINLRGRSHITIEGITVTDVKRFLVAKRSSHITISRCRFDTARGWESCSLKDMGDYLRFTDNLLKDGSDLFSVQGGNYHLIEGNTFDTATHETLTLMGVQRSVVRGNTFTNPKQKLTSILTTRGNEWKAPPRKSKYNLIERNVFGPAWLTPENSSSSGSGSAAIQYAANEMILRRNVFKRCGMGMDFCGYGEGEAMFNRSNRFYNNVVYDCGWPALYGSGPGIVLSHGKQDFGDQVIVNNILYLNRIYPDAHTPKDAPRMVQIAFKGKARPSEARFFRNDIMGYEPGEIVVWDNNVKRGYTLKGYEAKYPQWAARNIEADPMFADAEGGDFRLSLGSPCIDAGGPLTRTKSAGEGRAVEVADALFFCDGYGIVEPDVIRVGKRRVTIVKVDYEANRITVDRRISWKAGAPVSLDYEGEAPDIGAFEFVAPARGR